MKVMSKCMSEHSDYGRHINSEIAGVETVLKMKIHLFVTWLCITLYSLWEVCLVVGPFGTRLFRRGVVPDQSTLNQV